MAKRDVEPERFLIDTSAWISSFRPESPMELHAFLRHAIDSDRAATTQVIVLELLQGAKTREAWQRLKSLMESIAMLPVDSAVWERAYQLGFTLRRHGLTMPTVDLLIASVAIEHGCLLVHQDRHFELIRSFVPLHTRSFLNPETPPVPPTNACSPQ